MSRKKKHEEDHIDETWLIPYSDMLTLLLALFIVMFAMSQVNQQKFQKAAKEFNAVFSGGSGVMPEGGNSVAVLQETNSSDEAKKGVIEEDKMTEIKKGLEKGFAESGYGDKVSVGLNGEGLEVCIQDAVLFNSGDANVLQELSPVLLEISKKVKDLDNNIKIIGHTDNRPIRTAKFGSNWDLSAMRAINVMHYMVDIGGLKPEKLSIQAFGEYKPKYDNSTEEGQAKNRRVEIFIVRNYPKTNKKVDGFSKPN